MRDIKFFEVDPFNFVNQNMFKSYLNNLVSRLSSLLFCKFKIISFRVYYVYRKIKLCYYYYFINGYIILICYYYFKNYTWV